MECVKDVFGKMGVGQSCDVDVVLLRQKENGPIIRPIIVEFRSEYDKWTVIRMKAKLRECEEYRSVFLEMDLSREERGTKRIQHARGWCATVGGTVQIVSTYPASPEARPPSFLGKPVVRPRTIADGAPTPCGMSPIQDQNQH